MEVVELLERGISRSRRTSSQVPSTLALDLVHPAVPRARRQRPRISPPILGLQPEIQHGRRCQGKHVEHQEDGMALDEARRLVVDLGADDAVGLDEDHDHGKGGRALRVAAVEGRVPAGADADGRVRAGRDEAAARHQRDRVGGREQDDEADDAETQAARHGDRFGLQPVRCRAQDRRRDDGEAVGNDAVELAFHYEWSRQGKRVSEWACWRLGELWSLENAMLGMLRRRGKMKFACGERTAETSLHGKGKVKERNIERKMRGLLHAENPKSLMNVGRNTVNAVIPRAGAATIIEPR